MPGWVEVASIDEQVGKYLEFEGSSWYLAYHLGYAQFCVRDKTNNVSDTWQYQFDERLQQAKRCRGTNDEASTKLLMQHLHTPQDLIDKLVRSFDPLIVLFLTSNSTSAPLEIDREHGELEAVVPSSEKIRIIKMHDVQAQSLGVKLASSTQR